MKNRQLFAVIALLIFAAVARFLPHPPNFSPVTAMVFLSGVLLANRGAALALPLLFVFLTDLIIGFYPGQWMVYVAYLSVGAIGILQSRLKTPWYVATVLGSAVSFFVVSNFSVWASGTLYTKDWAGLVNCFVMAIPFFPSTLASHIVFVVILGAVYRWGMMPLSNRILNASSES